MWEARSPFARASKPFAARRFFDIAAIVENSALSEVDVLI
jgi:hypothetical protein